LREPGRDSSFQDGLVFEIFFDFYDQKCEVFSNAVNQLIEVFAIKPERELNESVDQQKFVKPTETDNCSAQKLYGPKHGNLLGRPQLS
jgi:hypothetical protein